MGNCINSVPQIRERPPVIPEWTAYAGLKRNSLITWRKCMSLATHLAHGLFTFGNGKGDLQSSEQNHLRYLQEVICTPAS